MTASALALCNTVYRLPLSSDPLKHQPLYNERLSRAKIWCTVSEEYRHRTTCMHRVRRSPQPAPARAPAASTGCSRANTGRRQLVEGRDGDIRPRLRYERRGDRERESCVLNVARTSDVRSRAKDTQSRARGVFVVPRSTPATKMPLASTRLHARYAAVERQADGARLRRKVALEAERVGRLCSRVQRWQAPKKCNRWTAA